MSDDSHLYRWRAARMPGHSWIRKRRGKERADEEEQKKKKKNSKHDKEEKKDPAEYPAGFSYSWNCASGHANYKNK